jgi:multidrug transporter EmrE-like cation transporter
MAYVALAASIVLGVMGQLLMKWAAVGATTDHFAWASLYRVAFAIAVYSLGVVNWILALKRIRLSVAYPLTSLSYVGILIGSHYFFGELISKVQLVGTALVFFGGILVVRQAVPDKEYRSS